MAPPSLHAEIRISFTEKGIRVDGDLDNIVLAYGMLQRAMDVVRAQAAQKVETALVERPNGAPLPKPPGS